MLGMERWKKISAALVLYLCLVATSNGNISTTQPRSQIVQRSPAGSLAHGLASTNASTNANEYAWSQWGAWSACSRSCGGGVSIQERHCLPRNDNRWLRRRRRRRFPLGSDVGLNYPGGSGMVQKRWKIDEKSKIKDNEERISNLRIINKIEDEDHKDVDRLSFGEAHDAHRSERRGRQSDGDERRIVTNEGHRRVHRRAREVRSSDIGCRGLSKRYHECNTQPCSRTASDTREDQCAGYDRRPFKGRFYTWVAYVDADSPCTLNCRPRGQQFYASLALVADGTPCTKPGFRAICVQGTCKAVGREGMLSTSASRDVRCGRRLVSGLFTRPRLPLGYSHIATVPPGACRLNVSELVPSDNYIALKLTNGSYIMNGEFAVSSPGTYEAAGAQLVYKRGAGVETVYTHGPTMQSLDIMILYQHPNPSIKYEYLTDTLPEEAIRDQGAPALSSPVASSTPHQHRHHNAETHPKPDEPSQEDGPTRRFTWKIPAFNQCSSTCGGGVQIGKFRCVEEVNGKEVSPVHCAGPSPAPRRRRCNMMACPPRWRTTAWSTCPACGPATQTRNVGCVQDHSRGMTKISDSKCTTPMPPASQSCDIPNCDSNVLPESRGTRRQVHEHTERFYGPARPPLSRPYNRTVPSTDNDISAVLGPEYFSAAGGWLYTEWSECVGWCVGGGVRTRGVRCADPAGCPAARAPPARQTCAPRAACEPHTTHWFTGDWSPCSAECGGRQVRAVVCLGGAGRRARDAACSEPRPQSERVCGDNCRPAWFLSDWSQCTGACGAGVQSRTVWCARADANAAPARESECAGSRPPARRACDPPLCAPTAPTLATAAPTVAEVPPAHAPYYPPPPPPPPQPHTTPDPQRIPRNQIQHAQSNSLDEQSNNLVGTEGCTDRLSKCTLAAQARLCHSPYYSHYCCRSCSKTRA